MRGLSIREFANLVKISPSYLCDLEKGYRLYPASKPELFDKIVNVLHLSSEEKEELEKLRDECTSSRNKLDPALAEYLANTPSAQAALRFAKDKEYTEEDWQRIFNEEGE